MRNTFRSSRYPGKRSRSSDGSDSLKRPECANPRTRMSIEAIRCSDFSFLSGDLRARIARPCRRRDKTPPVRPSGRRLRLQNQRHEVAESARPAALRASDASRQREARSRERHYENRLAGIGSRSAGQRKASPGSACPMREHETRSDHLQNGMPIEKLSTRSDFVRMTTKGWFSEKLISSDHGRETVPHAQWIVKPASSTSRTRRSRQ